MIENIKYYFKYLKFYIKNKKAGNIKIPVYVNPVIKGFLILQIIPKLELINESEDIDFNLKMTDFKNYKDFFEYFSKNMVKTT